MTVAVPASSLRSPGSHRRLVSERARELGVLQAERQRSTRGEVRVGLVLGDAGLGKTWLATELLAHSNEVALGLTARSCLSRDIPPLSRWAEALGPSAATPSGDPACHACGSGLGGLPPLLHRTGTAHDAASCADALHHHLVACIPALLATASTHRPIVVVLDDAHHSHAAVWEMLLRLARDFPASRVFVLATVRPAELARNRSILEVLDALEQDAQILRVQLAPLSREDVQELAVATLQQDPVPSALADWLMVHAKGNPRCTVGLLEALVERSTDLQAPFLAKVPEKLARWIRTELARLDTPALTLAELLAVIGDPADPDDLARINQLPTEDVAVILERLVHFGTVVEQQREGSLGYTIAHPLLREVLYSDIGGARRRVLHRRVATALLEAGRPAAATAHFDRAARAGDGKAIDALIELAHRAQQRGLCAQTWTAVSALRDLLPIGDRRWFDLFAGLCRQSDRGIVDRTEHYVVDIASVRRMQHILAGVDDLQLHVELRLWLAGLFAYGAGDLDAGEKECRQALALSRRIGRDTAARSAAIELAKLRGWAGDLRGEEAAARELLREAEQAGDQQATADALGALGHALGWQGRFDAAEDVLTRSVELATAAAQDTWRGQGLMLLATFDACRGHLVSARTRWAQAAASRPRHDPMAGSCGEFIELLAGDLNMAQAHARQADGGAPAVPSQLPIRLACRAAMMAAERGALVDARQHLRAANRIERTALGILEPLSWWAEAAVARAEGRLSAAMAALRRAAESHAAMNALALRAFVLVDLVELTVVIGDCDAAASAVAETEDNARRTGAPLHQTIHLLASSWALIGRGHPETAARSALRAIDEFSSRGYVLLAARARMAYATAIQRSDHTSAHLALHQAAAAFDACGASVRAQQARSMLLQLGSAGQGATQAGGDQDALTRRERQVAELAAGGYTAAQIANQLHIGVRTVETHLARSYPKLGITSKQQLVRHAAKLGFRRGP